jgi:putative Mg2+ transporter-C (MgtC) family protein
MDIAPNQEIVFFLQLVIAMVLGAILGAERSMARKTAGMRTYAIVSLGSCLLIVISKVVTSNYLAPNEADSMLRVLAGIVSGIGFIGAGVIFSRQEHVNGLTTAAGLWIAAAIGIAVGFNAFLLATFGTFLTLFTFTVLWYVEEMIRRVSGQENSETD